MARVIEFYVPKYFSYQRKRWLVPEQRGKVIQIRKAPNWISVRGRSDSVREQIRIAISSQRSRWSSRGN